jgi:hypothetical protein
MQDHETVGQRSMIASIPVGFNPAMISSSRRRACRAARRGAPVHPQLSTGFPASPAYPHLGDNQVTDPYSWGLIQ